MEKEHAEFHPMNEWPDDQINSMNVIQASSGVVL